MASAAQVEIILKMIDKVSPTMDKVSSATKKMTGNMDKAGNSLKAFGAKSRQIGGNLTKNLTLPIVAIGGAMVKTFADFDATLTNIEARTGATAQEMEKIRKVAIDMGRDTAFSASAAADAMLELMSSGSSVTEAIATLPHVLDLAAAGQLGLGRASDLVTDVLAQFQLGVEDSKMVVDSLAQAAQSSSASIDDLAQGFGNVGPIAANFNINARQTASILAVFAENGIKGAQAGTQLKSMLTAMSSQTTRTAGAWTRLGTSMFDAAGDVKHIDAIIDDVNKGLTGMTEQERIATIQDLAGSFGQMGLSALLASDGVDTMLTKMFDSQSASEVAKKQMESFNGAVNQLSGSLQTMAIVVIGPFVKNTLQPMVEWITKALNKFTDWAAENEKLATAIVALVAALALIGPALWIIGAAASVFGTIASGASAVVGVISSIGGALSAISAIAAPLAAILTGTLIPAITGIMSTVATFGAGLLALATGPIGIAVLAIGALIAALLTFSPEFRGMVDQFGTIIKQALDNGAKVIQIMMLSWGEILKRAATAFMQLGWLIMKGLADGIIAGAKAVIQAVSDVGNALVGGLQSVLGIASPSKVMMEIGANVGAGFNMGVADSMGGVGSTAPSATPTLAIAGAGGGGNVIIHNLTTQGTTEEQINQIMDAITKRVQKRGGLSGRGVTY